MVRAMDLKIRANQVKAEQYSRVGKKVEEILSKEEERMLAAASRGMTSHIMRPYDNFDSDEEREMAKGIFNRILKDARYTIKENDVGRDRLVFSW